MSINAFRGKLLRPSHFKPKTFNLSYSTNVSVNPKPKFINSAKGKALVGASLLLGAYALYPSEKIHLDNFEEKKYTDKASYVEHPDPSYAFQNKSMYDLLVSLMVYKLCNLPILMDAAPTLLSLLETLHLAGPAYFIIKHTIFKHFCGGEDREDVVPFMRELEKMNIGSILDFSIEADLPEDNGNMDPNELRKNANNHADFVAEQYRQAVKTASYLKGSFIAVKVTGLVNPQLLEKATSILHFLRNSFILADKDNDGILNHQQFKDILNKLPNMDQQKINETLKRADPKYTNKIDWISFLSSLSMVKKDSSEFYLGEKSINQETQDYNLNVNFFSNEEQQDLNLLMSRLNNICTDAKELGVRLMIDAEQSYFQAAIDLVANELSQNYNTNQAIVFNTYQMYLKESYEKMRNDLIHAKRENWSFGAKLVRGAYMVSERKRALDLGLPDIIQDTIEDTHKDYNNAVDLLLSELATQTKKDKPLCFMVASHNKDSVVQTCRKMEQLNIDPSKSQVLFGQLMGMHDPTTYALAKQGFAAFKYIPYGPVKEVMPYLIRRAQENSSVMQGANLEQLALWNEIKRRVFNDTPKEEIEVTN